MSLVEMPQEAELVDDVDLSSMTLDELAGLIDTEHLLVGDSMSRAATEMSAGLHHGIACGKALLAAKSRIEEGRFIEWVDAATDVGYLQCKRYIRWAFYEDHIVASGKRLTAYSVNAFLRGLPPVPDARGGVICREVVEEARRLESEGVSRPEIAELLGMTVSAVRYYTSSPQRMQQQRELNSRRARERRAAKRALAEKQKQEAIRKAGGNISAAYSYVRKAAAELDAALGDATSPEVRQALRAALAGVHKAEDEIGKAVRHG